MTGFILTLHSYNPIFILASAAVAGIWGLVLFFTRRAMIRPWRISLMVATAFGALQGLLGLVLVLMNLKPGGGTGLYYLHYVYGGIVILALPIALTYTSGGKNERRDILIFSIAAFILAAAGVRAWLTGPL